MIGDSPPCGFALEPCFGHTSLGLSLEPVKRGDVWVPLAGPSSCVSACVVLLVPKITHGGRLKLWTTGNVVMHLQVK